MESLKKNPAFKSAVPCSAHHITWGPKGGQCLNCGGEGPACYSVQHVPQYVKTTQGVKR